MSVIPKSRYVPEGKINTLSGKLGIRKKMCKCCGQVKEQSLFYHEYKSELKSFGVCVICDDERRSRNLRVKTAERNGIYIDKKTEESIVNTLEFWMEDD
jgi:hypothetical protein